MVQPLPCHSPAPPAADALSAAALAGAPPQACVPASVARCHARTGAPARDLLLVARGAAAATSGSAARAASATTARATTSSVGYAASAVASAAASALGAATKKTTTSTAKKKSSGALAFLDDRALTTDEKLMRLLVHLESKWQKDIERRLKELAAGTAKRSSSAASSSGSKKSGLLGSVVKFASSVVPGVGSSLALLEDPQTRKLVSQVSGPLLAAGLGAAGFPELAPLALKYAPQAVDALGSAATSADRAARSGGSSTSSTSSSDLSPDAFEKIQLMELQRVMEHQKELFSMVSNLLRSGHDLRMNVIQNVR